MSATKKQDDTNANGVDASAASSTAWETTPKNGVLYIALNALVRCMFPSHVGDDKEAYQRRTRKRANHAASLLGLKEEDQQKFGRHTCFAVNAAQACRVLSKMAYGTSKDAKIAARNFIDSDDMVSLCHTLGADLEEARKQALTKEDVETIAMASSESTSPLVPVSSGSDGPIDRSKKGKHGTAAISTGADESEPKEAAEATLKPASQARKKRSTGRKRKCMDSSSDTGSAAAAVDVSVPVGSPLGQSSAKKAKKQDNANLAKQFSTPEFMNAFDMFCDWFRKQPDLRDNGNMIRFWQSLPKALDKKCLGVDTHGNMVYEQQSPSDIDDDDFSPANTSFGGFMVDKEHFEKKFAKYKQEWLANKPKEELEDGEEDLTWMLDIDEFEMGLNDEELDNRVRLGMFSTGKHPTKKLRDVPFDQWTQSTVLDWLRRDNRNNTLEEDPILVRIVQHRLPQGRGDDYLASFKDYNSDRTIDVWVNKTLLHTNDKHTRIFLEFKANHSCTNECRAYLQPQQ